MNVKRPTTALQAARKQLIMQRAERFVKKRYPPEEGVFGTSVYVDMWVEGYMAASRDMRKLQKFLKKGLPDG